ncbi:MAG: hypothetical protein N3A54_05995, partial [Patescibacteria group bacterium]|nr:hypothetical protein [Patescibacteria group bacterium]
MYTREYMSSRVFRYIRSYLPIGLIVFFVLFSMVPTIYEWMNRGKIKPIRYFELVHNFPTDYQLYLSKIRQGKEGAWLAKEKYTTEPHEGSLSQILYVLIGRVSHWVHVQTPYVWFSYHVMRVFFAGLLLFVIWKIAQWAYKSFSWQILAFLLIVTASTWPKFETVDGWPRFGGYMPWYTVVDSLQRTTFLPHVMAGQAMLAFILWVFSGGFITRQRPGNWVFLGIIGIILGIIFPPALFFIYGVLVFWSMFDIVSLVQRPGLSMGVRMLFGRIVFMAMTFPTMVYYALLFQQYPWKRLVEFDVLHPTKFSYSEYFLAVGPTLPLGLLGFLAVALRKEKKFLGMCVWVFAWLFFVFIFNFIPQQSPTRFSQMAPHIPLGILSLYGVHAAYEWMKRYAKKRMSPDAVLIVPIVVILLGLGTMYSSWLWQKDFVDHKFRADIPLVPKGAEVMYPLYDLVDAMVWLQVYTPRTVAVLSGPATGNLIPVYSGNYTYVGHANTVNAEMKEIVVANFFGRKRPAEE